MTNETSTKRDGQSVAGVDLGPSLVNDSTGVQIATWSGQEQRWIVKRSRGHRVKKGPQRDCNVRVAKEVAACSIVVIDAPLLLESEKPWETALMTCPGLTTSMRPSRTSGILSHAWRASDLLKIMSETTRGAVYEIFPACWFWLCEFDTDVKWKGDEKVKRRKIRWFRERNENLAQASVCTIEYAEEEASGDEADALACVLCGILLAEGCMLQCLDDTSPPVLFPPRILWDKARLPGSVQNLKWMEFEA
jgi:predicted nuclease with RNAse H fold